MTGQRPHRLAFIWLALYAVFLAATPFEHHDLACELKTPLHCTACTSSVVGPDPTGPTPADTTALTDVGSAFTIEFRAPGVLLPVRSTGRSPPASA